MPKICSGIWQNCFIDIKNVVCLKLHTHDAEIRKQAKRVGQNDESRKEVHKLMNSCKVVCSNCWIKLDNDLIEFL